MPVYSFRDKPRDVLVVPPTRIFIMFYNELIKYLRSMITNVPQVFIPSVSRATNDTDLHFCIHLLHELSQLHESIRVVRIIHHHSKIPERENVHAAWRKLRPRNEC